MKNYTKPLTEDLFHWDRYRGNKNLTWKPEKEGRESFAIRCEKCGQWHGWTFLYEAEELDKQFRKKGCSKCNKQTCIKKK